MEVTDMAIIIESGKKVSTIRSKSEKRKINANTKKIIEDANVSKYLRKTIFLRLPDEITFRTLHETKSPIRDKYTI